MIHQIIFASPKPGMSDEDFASYWLNVHAVKFAGKIPQIRLYKVNTPVVVEGIDEPAPWVATAEIWLKNEAEQLASLQSKEFIEGARADEPNWAAFWLSLGLDTDAKVILPGPPEVKPAVGVKLMTLWKRKPGMILEDFRGQIVEQYSPLLLRLPGVRRLLVNLVRDGAYAVGESRFDAVTQTWFDDEAALSTALGSDAIKDVRGAEGSFAEPKYKFSMAVKEHWIIGPEPR